MIIKDVDAVITYVDGTDPNWLQQYHEYSKIHRKKNKINRFRSYGTLGLLTKCIQKFMPFIDNIYIVVASESQIPKNDVFINTSNVKFIFHDQIIPIDKLPTFNSQVIESFLHKIPDLKEHFIYFNDDMFPIKPLKRNDFYTEDDKPVWRLRRRDNTDDIGIFLKVCQKGYIRAWEFAKPNRKVDNRYIIVPEHSIAPMFKSDYTTIFNHYEELILNEITPFRSVKNVNQYLFSLYSVFKRGYHKRQENIFKYNNLQNFINYPVEYCQTIPEKTICVNDNPYDKNISIDTCITNFKLCLNKILED